MPRRQMHQGLKFPTENILTHTFMGIAMEIPLAMVYNEGV